jgi:hypothetical protein
MKEHIGEIPLSKEIMFEQEVTVDVPCGEEGKTIPRTVKVKKKVFVDNTEERMKALERLIKLQELEEKFRSIIERERKLKEHDLGESMLEQNNFKNQPK